MTILIQVSAYAPDDEIVQGIVEENANICATAEAIGAQPAYETPAPPTQSATAAP
jgi:hypothetical protein